VEPLIELKDVHKSFGGLEVLNGISLTVYPGEIVAVIGSSGSGKSTLIRCINGLESVQSGQILIKGVPVNAGRKQAREMRKKVGMVFQNFNLFPHYTVLENITRPMIIANKADKRAASETALELLKKVKLEDKVASYPASLSGGQKQRVAIARVLAMNPDIILFDEPTSALDPELAYEVLDTIKSLAQDGLTMVIVTHQINFISQVANRMVFLDGGVISQMGTPEEILSNDSNERLKRFLIRLKEST
jgi:ABC-type polar amino acid transport system ATPase subunit